MKNRKGQVLMQVLVMCAVLVSVCVVMAKYALQSRTLQRKTVQREEALGNLEGVNAKLWACLADNGYPAAGTCGTPVSAGACTPAGATLAFSGTWPECRVKITVEN